MRLMCWLELVDSSALSRPRLIAEILNTLGFDDTDVTVEGPALTEALDAVERFSVLYWEVLPGLEAGFAALSKALSTGEYLLFEEKTRYGMRSNSTLRIVRVTAVGVDILSGDQLLEVGRANAEGL